MSLFMTGLEGKKNIDTHLQLVIEGWRMLLGRMTRRQQNLDIEFFSRDVEQRSIIISPR